MAALLFMHCDREKKKIQWFVDDDSDTTHFFHLYMCQSDQGISIAAVSLQ